MSILGLELEYTVKYTPSPSQIPLGFALGISFRQMDIFDSICLLSSLYGYNISFSQREISVNIIFSQREYLCINIL